MAFEGFKSFLRPILENIESNTVATYSQKIQEGALEIEEYTISKGDSIDYIIYNYIQGDENKSLEEVRYDIKNINAAKGIDITVLYPGQIIYLPVYE